MKKFAILIVLSLALFSVKAQAPMISTNTAALIKTLDTVTNTGTKVMTNPVAVTGTRESVTIMATVNKISGTPAGTVVLYGSLDGVNYSLVPATLLTNSETATFTLTNVQLQSYAFVVVHNPFAYYQLLATGSGTVSMTIAGKIRGY